MIDRDANMRTMGIFGAFAVPAFCTKVQNIVDKNEYLGISIAKLPLHSPERNFFIEHCTILWKRRASPEVAALLYETMFFGNDSRYPRNRVEAGTGLERFEEMKKNQNVTQDFVDRVRAKLTMAAVDQLSQESLEWRYFMGVCALGWQWGLAPEKVALGYEGSFVGNGGRFPRSREEGSAGWRRFEEMKKD